MSVRPRGASLLMAAALAVLLLVGGVQAGRALQVMSTASTDGGTTWCCATPLLPDLLAVSFSLKTLHYSPELA